MHFDSHIVSFLCCSWLAGEMWGLVLCKVIGLMLLLEWRIILKVVHERSFMNKSFEASFLPYSLTVRKMSEEWPSQSFLPIFCPLPFIRASVSKGKHPPSFWRNKFFLLFSKDVRRMMSTAFSP